MEFDKKYIYWGLGAVGVLIVYYLIVPSSSSASADTGMTDYGAGMPAVLGSPYVSLQGSSQGASGASSTDTLANVQLELGKIQLANEQALGLGQIDLQKLQIQAATDTAHFNADSAIKLQQQQADALGLTSLLQNALSPGETRTVTTSSGASVVASSQLGAGSADQQIQALYSGMAGINLTAEQMSHIKSSGLNLQQLTSKITGSYAYESGQNDLRAQAFNAYKAKYGAEANAGIVDWLVAKVQSGQALSTAVRGIGSGVSAKAAQKAGGYTQAITAKRKITNTGAAFEQIVL